MSLFNAKTDTPAVATTLAGVDKTVFGDVSADAWETLFANATLEALSRVSLGPLSYDGLTVLANCPIQQSSVEKRVTANVTNNTATMGNISDLSVNVISGHKYTFALNLFVVDSAAAEGIKVDFDGGNAAMTSFRAHGLLFDTALLLSVQTTAIATDFAAALATGDSMLQVTGSFVPSGNGTFIPRFAQNSHTTGTATVYLGSHLLIKDLA